MTASTATRQSRRPSPSLKQAFRLLRLAPSPTANVPPAAPVAHPFTHDQQPTRCPACELRAYLDG